MTCHAQFNKFCFFKYITIFFIWIILFEVETVCANGPKLKGSMKAFQLTPVVNMLKEKHKEISWQNVENKTLGITHFKGKIILLNFWASWCLPCIRELPSMDRLQQSLGGSDFSVVAISLDRGGAKVAKRLFRRIKITNLKLYVDKTSASAKKLGVRFMPTTFIFDRKGRKIGKLQKAAEWDSPEAKDLIKFFINHPDFRNTPTTQTN